MSDGNARCLFTIVCDDVRPEVGNKISMMGIYDQALIVGHFPVVIPKLCFVMKARTPADEPFQSLSFVVRRDGEALILAEMDIAQLENTREVPMIVAPDQDDPDQTDKVRQVTAIMSLAPFALEKPCRLWFRAITESGELQGGSLAIGLAPDQERMAGSGPG